MKSSLSTSSSLEKTIKAITDITATESEEASCSDFSSLILEFTDLLKNNIASAEVQSVGLKLLTMKAGGVQCSTDDVAIIETSKTSLTEIQTRVEKVVTKTETQIEKATGSKPSISITLLTDDGTLEEDGEATTLKTEKFYKAELVTFVETLSSVTTIEKVVSYVINSFEGIISAENDQSSLSSVSCSKFVTMIESLSFEDSNSARYIVFKTSQIYTLCKANDRN